VDGILFLVDSADPKRFQEAKTELENVLNTPELAKIPLAILGNKIDRSEAVREDEIKESLELNTLFAKAERPMELFMCSVNKGVGYANAFQWISSYLK